MILKESELKAIIKQIVRETIAEKCGNQPAGAVDEMGPDSKITPLDDIVRLVQKKNVKDPEKVKFLVAQLYLHQMGRPADMDMVDQAIERNSGTHPGDGSGMDKGSQGPLSIGPLEETGEEGGEVEAEVTPAEYESGHNNSEEVQLVQAVKAVVAKLAGMHKTPAKSPSKSPSKSPPKKEKEEPEKEEGEGEEKKVDEASYKVVAPRSATDAKEDKARKIQTEPKVNEASHKVVAPNEVDAAKEDKARKIQTEPKVTENHRVQARSFKTVKDYPNNPDPAGTRDPEVPQV